jgi:protein-S-isoprenylcysteine O-methyltransferase Ste14
MLKTISIAGYLVMVAATIALVVKHNLFSSSPIVIAIQVGAGALFLWARIEFGRRSYHFAANPTEGGLVTTGPYRYLRHPIYTGMTLFVAAGVAAHLSWGSASLFVVVLTGAVVRIICEETLVTRRYPEYVAYSQKTWRMLPFVF